MSNQLDPIVKIYERVIFKDQPFILKMSQCVQTEKQEHEKYDSKELYDNLENTKSSLQELQEKFIQLAEDLEE